MKKYPPARGPGLRPAAVAAALALGAAAVYADSPVKEALERPALQARAAEHSVLLAAAKAGSRIVAVGERGIVVLSDDGGQHWRQAPVPVSVTLTGVRFSDAEHGWAIGHGAVVLATSDGGRTWTRRLDGRQLGALLLADAKASGDAAALKSAQRFVDDGPDKPLLDLLVLDAKRLVVVGAYGIALASDDGGATWRSWRSRLDNPKELHLYAIRQNAGRIVIAGEQGLVLQSLDEGRAFKRLATPYAGSFFTAELPDAHTVVLAGLRGNVWRSVDGGGSWKQLQSPAPVSVTGSALGADGQPLFANQAGMVLAVAGDALQPLHAAGLPLNSLLPLDAGHVLALSIQGPLPVDLRSPGAARKPPSR